MSTIHTEHFFPHPPAKIWQALTDPEMMGRWLMKNNFQPVLGHQFHFDTGNWGLTQCEVLEMTPEKTLRYSWKNPPLDTEVTWTLVAENGGTRLILDHSGFNLEDPRQKFAYDGMKAGWEQMQTARFPGVLG